MQPPIQTWWEVPGQAGSRVACSDHGSPARSQYGIRNLRRACVFLLPSSTRIQLWQTKVPQDSVASLS